MDNEFLVALTTISKDRLEHVWNHVLVWDVHRVYWKRRKIGFIKLFDPVVMNEVDLETAEHNSDSSDTNTICEQKCMNTIYPVSLFLIF